MARVKKGKSLAVIKQTSEPAETDRDQVNKDRFKRTTEFKTIAETVAKSSIYHKNYYVPELEKQYKAYERFRRIDKVFPYARLGDSSETCLLLVDEPNTDMEIDQCVKKAIILKELGYKYCFIDKHADMIDILMQLGST